MSLAVQAQTVRAQITRVGVWLGSLGEAPARTERAALARLEELGYGAAWIGESPINREALSHAAMLLDATEQITIATGIANIWVRDATAAINGANALNEAQPGRFILGLGVSHAPAVEFRGHHYGKPLSAMRGYLDAIDAHTYGLLQPQHPTPIVLGALRRNMLELARDRTIGAHPFLVSPAHTAAAREVLGPQPLLAPQQGVVLETDAPRARDVARKHIALHLNLPNYQANLRQLGFVDDDFANGGSYRLIDAVVAWGDEEAITTRVQEHINAGADHVAIQVYPSGSHGALEQLERLAPALTNVVGRPDAACRPGTRASAMKIPAGNAGGLDGTPPA